MANAMPKITIQGDSELMQLIRSLPERTLTACSTAMRAGARPIIAAARSNLKRNRGINTGLLKKSIGVRALKANRKENRVYMYIGPRGPGKQRFKSENYEGRKRSHIPLNIAHLIEFGHRIAVEKQGGISRKNYRLKVRKPSDRQGFNAGSVQGIPFLRPAVDSNRVNFLNTLKEAFKKEVEKRAAKGQMKLNIPRWQGEGKGGDL